MFCNDLVTIRQFDKINNELLVVLLPFDPFVIGGIIGGMPPMLALLALES
jgi:hypothetical protein